MDGGSVALLMNTVFGVSFLSAFFVIHLLDRSRTAPLWFAAVFLIGLGGAAVEFRLPTVENPQLDRWWLFVFTATSLGLMSVGIARLYNRKPHFVILSVVIVVLAAINWIIIDTPRDSFEYQLLRQASYGLIVLFSLRHVVSLKVKTGAEHFLFGALILLLCQFLARPSIALLTGGMGATANEYLFTDYATIILLLFSVAMITLSFSLLLICMRDLADFLREQAHIDEMTGLLNRRGLDSGVMAKKAELQSNKADIRHALIITDIDRFKAINDTHGHAAGDQIIMSFARILQQTIGNDNLAVRYGGEEFVIVLWNTPVEAARLMAEGLRTLFSATVHEASNGNSVTASFGVAWWNPDEDFYSALRSADRALYRAKEAGRDRVELAREGVDPDYSSAASA